MIQLNATIEIVNHTNGDEELQPQQDDSIGHLNHQARRVTRRKNTGLDSLNANQPELSKQNY